jgi:hypothetical protein
VRNPERLVIGRDSEPVNEFEDNAIAIMDSFPDAFPRGVGLSGKGTISKEERLHLLRQATLQFSQIPQLIFLLFNQMQRHLASQSVSSRVKNTPEAFEAFAQDVSDPAFAALVVSAQANPEGAEAKKVLERVSRYLQICGSVIPWSTSERKQEIAKIYGLLHRYGKPTIFLTISPDDVHQTMSIRLSLPQTGSPLQFPAQVGDFEEALRRGNSTYLDFPIDEAALQSLAGNNPVAVSEFFKEMMEAVYTTLLGISPAHIMSRKTSIFGGPDRPDGAFGGTRAFFIAFETQGRMALHGHLISWNTLSPDFFQAASSIPMIKLACQAAIDSFIQAKVGLSVHAESIIRKLEKGPKPPRPAFQASVSPLDVDRFEFTYEKAAEFLQMHCHHPTCQNSRSGKEGCRFCMPAVLSEFTGPKQLDEQGVPLECVQPNPQSLVGTDGLPTLGN